MTLIWVLIILAIFFFLSKTSVIETLTTGEEESIKNQGAIESDYQFPVRDLELGRDPAAEAGRGDYKYDIPITRESPPQPGDLAGMETQPQKIPGMPESATQTMPIPMPETNNMMDDAGPQPTSEVSDVVAPAMTDELRAGTTVGVQGQVMTEESPSIKQFKSLGISRVNRMPNTRVVYESGLLGVRTAEDEFECVAECQDHTKCGMYSYQPKQQVCFLHQKPDTNNLFNFLERAPTYNTGFINRGQI